jgi:hypothetical protein
MTLCLMRVRGRAEGGFCDTGVDGDPGLGTAARGAAARPARNSLLFMPALYDARRLLTMSSGIDRQAQLLGRLFLRAIHCHETVDVFVGMEPECCTKVSEVE